MQPSNEKVAPNQHDYSRDKGYVEKPYEHQEYPKVVGGTTVNSAEEEAALAQTIAANNPEVSKDLADSGTD